MNLQIAQLIEGSQDGNVEWYLTSDPFTFETEYQGSIYTIHAKPGDLDNETASLYSWNDKEEVIQITETEEDKRQCYQLLQTIFKIDGRFKMNFKKKRKSM